MPIELAPPPYMSATGKTETTASSYEMEEEEDIFDLKFNEDAQTQPYLSLGLTPLSQLSPPDTTVQSSGGDSYFFPSMLPPVTPISSVFSMNGTTSSGVGIPVDSPFQLGPGGTMVMPEAYPVAGGPGAGEPLSNARRMGRRGKHEVNSHSQGYAMKLEPVLEQNSLDEPTRDTFGDPLYQRSNANGMGSSSSSAEDPTFALLNSSDINERGDSSRPPPHLRRKVGKRRKSGTRRKLDEDSWDDHDSEDLVMRNGALMQPYDFPVKLSREENSPRQEGRRLRQQLREQELTRQKEKLRLKLLEEEKAHWMQQEQRAAQIVHDYGSTRQRKGEQMISPHSSGLVLEQAMHFEAQAQLQGLRSTGPTSGHNLIRLENNAESLSYNSNSIVNTSNQFSVL